MILSKKGDGGPFVEPTSAKATESSLARDWVAGIGLSDSSGPGLLVEQEGSSGVLNGYTRWKRGADVVLGVLGIAGFAPLMLLAAILVKLTSPGPVFYAQERVGLNRRFRERRGPQNGGPPTDRRGKERRQVPRHGKPFRMYKFRSMRDGAENGQPTWTSMNDPRVTRVGRWLRKTRMDETPQFFNVLKGDMSIVGPRPERDYFYQMVGREIPQFRLRLMTKPGLTGLAQINVGYCNKMSEMHHKLEHDLEYIRTVSPSTDAKILARTVSVVVTGRGAF
jgi:lipopolysaccharide/colanic/teichoic acid biosynthesis glycosyltransferase